MSLKTIIIKVDMGQINAVWDAAKMETQCFVLRANRVTSRQSVVNLSVKCFSFF